MRWLVSLIVAVVSAVSVAAQPPADAPRVDGTVQRVSAAERVCDCDEGVQCPNERKPIFFMRVI